MKVDEICVVGLAIALVVGIILGSTYHHLETNRFIASGYHQQQKIGDEGFIWVK